MVEDKIASGVQNDPSVSVRELLILLVRWVQIQTYAVEVEGRLISPLQKDTEVMLKKLGMIDQDDKWIIS